jgi:hypothetical protein
MTPHPQQLGQLQRWMLDAITAEASIEPQDLREKILPSQRQSADERLAVYRRAYLARLLEVLRELFPCTRFAVGDDLFDQFAAGYLEQHPPHSYTLGRLADHVVEYLDASRPADWGRFVVELACLEHAIDRIFDAPGPEQLPPLKLPPDATKSIHLHFVPGFELHAFEYPVSTFYTDWKANRQPPWPERNPQFVALFRRDYIVRRHALSAVQYQLLLKLHGGASLDEALAATAVTSPASSDELAADFHKWFADWAAEPFFAEAW